jgi:hypothetical protein
MEKGSWFFLRGLQSYFKFVGDMNSLPEPEG